MTPVLCLATGQSGSENPQQETSTTSVEVLKYFEAQWRQFTISLAMVHDIFPYFVGVYGQDHPGIPSLDARLRGSFRDNLLYHHISSPAFDGEILDIIFAIIFNQISLSRRGKSMDREALRANIGIFFSLYATDEEKEDQQLYTTEFEPRFVNYSNEFFAKEARNLMQADMKTWLTATKHFIEQETDLHRTTIWGPRHRGAVEIVELQVIRGYLEHQAVTLEKEVRAMISNEDFELLKLLYQNIYRVDTELQFLQEVLRSFIGDLAIPSASVPILANRLRATHVTEASLFPNPHQGLRATWIIRLLKLEKKLLSVWWDGLERDPILGSVLSRGFSALFHDHPESCKLLSQFFDMEVRAITERNSCSDAHSLKEIASLLQYVSDMATFEYWYKVHLGERLLQNSSAMNLGLEKEIIDMMRIDTGDLYADELDCMVDDIKASEEITREFLEDDSDCNKTAAKRVELSVSIFTRSVWPSYMFHQVVDSFHNPGRGDSWPPELRDIQDHFAKFYVKHTHKSLVWLKSLGTATMICNFPEISDGSTHLPSRQYQLVAPTQYVIILLLFNNTSECPISFRKIVERSGLPLDTTLTILEDLTQSLELQILQKISTAGRSDSEALYIFNDKFTSKSPIITVPNPRSAYSVDHENDLQRYTRRRERNNIEALEACIVRIMK